MNFATEKATVILPASVRAEQLTGEMEIEQAGYGAEVLAPAFAAYDSVRLGRFGIPAACRAGRGPGRTGRTQARVLAQPGQENR